jgi:acetylornithine deacetylase/succinyl-diaminopimelate desuccinylase-like protein
MDTNSLKKYIEKQFTLNVLPNLMNFIRIPNLSPLFDPNWNKNGLLLKAANLIVSYAKSLNIKNAEINLLQDSPYTPLIFIDIPASRQNDERTVLFYAHYDKQPYGTGWDEDKSPTNPVIIDGHLYGRGSADDGYASFSILTAIKTCQEYNCPMPRICCIFEGAEESRDVDLKYYFNKLMPVLGQNIIAFIPLDAGCSDYNRLWMTNSLRGYFDFDVNIETLQQESHYGPEASGIIAENLFLVRKLYDGIIDSTNGEFKLEEFKVDQIPAIIEEQMQKEIEVVGEDYIKNIPLYDGVSPLKNDVRELMINNRWKPTCNILGMDNCPKMEDRGFGVNPSIKVHFSMRVPPLINKDKAIDALKIALTSNTFFGAKVSLGYYEFGEGTVLANMTNRTKNVLNKASLEFFGNEMIFNGGGGSIPFITYFKSFYPNTDIICTGVLGADSHEHGPNENLNIEACKKMICVLCYFLSEI